MALQNRLVIAVVMCMGLAADKNINELPACSYFVARAHATLTTATVTMKFSVSESA